MEYDGHFVVHLFIYILSIEYVDDDIQAIIVEQICLKKKQVFRIHLS